MTDSTQVENGGKHPKTLYFDLNDTSSDSETEENNNNFAERNDSQLLGALRAGMNTIRIHTRQTLANCKSDESYQDTSDQIKSSTLKLMRDEKTFCESWNICIEIVDEVSNDLDEIEEYEGGGNGDEKQNVVPIWDRILVPCLPSLEVIIATREKMSQMLDQRLKIFNESITDEDLKTQSNYMALQKEINLGREDFEQKQNLKLLNIQKRDEDEDEDEDVFITAAKILASRKDEDEIDFGEESPGEEESNSYW